MTPQRVLFRCDGGRIPEIGTGHLRRCLWLLDALIRRAAARVQLVMRNDPEGLALVRQSGVEVTLQTFADPEDESAAMTRALETSAPHVCVFDRLNVPEALLGQCARAGAVVVTLDDVACGPRLADVAVNGILEHPRTCYSGADYVVLPELPQTALAHREGGRQDRPISLFVSVGGFDPQQLAARVLAVVKELPDVSEVYLVAADEPTAVACRALVNGRPRPRLHVLHHLPNLTQVMDQCNLAVVSGGLTLFETMRRGLASIVVPQYPHQLVTAQRYAARGAAIAVDSATEAFDRQLREAVVSAGASPEFRRQLGMAAQQLVDGRGLKRVVDLIRICEVLEWDSAFFGIRIADLKPLRLTDQIIRYALEYCRQEDVECLYYQADCHDPQSVRLAEQHGFHFVDVRLTFERDFTSCPVSFVPSKSSEAIVRPCRLEDIPALKEIAGDSYLHSRYYFDERFPRARCGAFYTEWTEKCADGRLAEQVFVVERGEEPVGYVTCTRSNPWLGRIDLAGVRRDCRGQGIGRTLVNAALQWFQERDVARVQVVTQGRNAGSQRLYQRCGFLTKHVRHWYHKWFDR